MQAQSRLLTDGEAAQLLRILPARLLKLARAGHVPDVALPDGELRFDEADLLRRTFRYCLFAPGESLTAPLECAIFTVEARSKEKMYEKARSEMRERRILA